MAKVFVVFTFAFFLYNLRPLVLKPGIKSFQLAVEVGELGLFNILLEFRRFNSG